MALERMVPEVGEIPVFPKIQTSLPDWRDGLLIRSPNWLGDAVMSLPALATLRQIIPEPCGLFVVCPRGLAPLFRMLPGTVNSVVELSDPHAFPTRGEWKSVRWLNAGIALLLNNSFRDALWIKSCRIPKLYGAKARFRSFLLARSFQFSPRRDHELNKPHQAAKYLAMARALGAPEWDGIPPEFFIPQEPETYSDELRAVLREENLLALAPGAAYGAAKRWDPLRFRDVADWWIRKRQGKVVLLCAGKEASDARLALTGLPAGSYYDLGGKTTLETLMLVLKQARICIANDSGAMHLAAVLGTPGVAPFGSTDPAATSPLSARWRILFDKQPCAPCFKRVCPKADPVCMKAICAADMIAAVDSLC
ncbi:MAG: lipopolysaccharide heptosyltransferase II [Lentisphaeria bacterium]|nr:lipopolysaccharide heptosyltransferase II [Lentisphaeria bacterium]